MRSLGLFLLVLAGCTDTRTAITGTQSLRITLVSPSDPGAPNNRLPDSQRTVTVDVQALDADGQPDPTFDKDVQVYAQFLGTLTPTFGFTPLVTFHVTAGVATNQQIPLPNVFGPTVLWIDDGFGLAADYVHGTITGTSTTLWFRDPFIADLQTPRDEVALDALAVAPLDDKQISVSASRHGARGRLVVNSVFSQGYTVTDVLCADELGSPPCTTPPRTVVRDDPSTSGVVETADVVGYDHAMVFTFSAPRDQFFGSVEVGQVIAGFAGGLSEFNNLTEIAFPQSFIPVDQDGNGIVDVNASRVPAPVLFDSTWFNALNDPDGQINFERNEGGLIQVNNTKVCELDEDFDKFGQWKLDPAGIGGDCLNNDNVISVVTTGLTAIDPAALGGQTLTRVVGVLRPIFNHWIIHPRSTADVDLP